MTTPAKLTGSDRRALAVIPADAWIANTALKARHGWTLVGAQRRKLNNAGLVTSRKAGRCYQHTLTAPAAPLEDEIRRAHRTLTSGQPGWVSLARLRPMLTGTTRDEVDAELRRMEQLPDVAIAPEENQKALTPADRAAAIRLGGKDKHLLWVEA